jgi:hypothetical protein
MSAENAMKMMSADRVISPSDEDAAIEFAGQTWTVRSLVGDKALAVALMEGPGTEPSNPGAIVGLFLNAAVTLSVTLSEGDRDGSVEDALSRTLANMMAESRRRRAEVMAQLSKPS